MMSKTKKPSPKKPTTKKEKNVTAEKPKRVIEKRRSPYEMLTALKTKLVELTTTYEKKVEKVNARIALLEQKHADKIAVGNLLSSKTPEELARELDEVKQQQSLLRKALKVAK